MVIFGCRRKRKAAKSKAEDPETAAEDTLDVLGLEISFDAEEFARQADEEEAAEKAERQKLLQSSPDETSNTSATTGASDSTGGVAAKEESTEGARIPIPVSQHNPQSDAAAATTIPEASQDHEKERKADDVIESLPDKEVVVASLVEEADGSQSTNHDESSSSDETAVTPSQYDDSSNVDKTLPQNEAENIISADGVSAGIDQPAQALCEEESQKLSPSCSRPENEHDEVHKSKNDQINESRHSKRSKRSKKSSKKSKKSKKRHKSKRNADDDDVPRDAEPVDKKSKKAKKSKAKDTKSSRKSSKPDKHRDKTKPEEKIEEEPAPLDPSESIETPKDRPKEKSPQKSKSKKDVYKESSTKTKVKKSKSDKKESSSSTKVKKSKSDKKVSSSSSTKKKKNKSKTSKTSPHSCPPASPKAEECQPSLSPKRTRCDSSANVSLVEIVSIESVPTRPPNALQEDHSDASSNPDIFENASLDADSPPPENTSVAVNTWSKPLLPGTSTLATSSLQSTPSGTVEKRKSRATRDKQKKSVDVTVDELLDAPAEDQEEEYDLLSSPRAQLGSMHRATSVRSLKASGISEHHPDESQSDSSTYAGDDAVNSVIQSLYHSHTSFDSFASDDE